MFTNMTKYADLVWYTYEKVIGLETKLWLCKLDSYYNGYL